MRGGATTLENLALACSGCNGHKYDKREGYDSVSEQMVELYHPRQHFWGDHFGWSEDYTLLLGLTPIGRATLVTLHMNRPAVVNLRYVLFLLACIHQRIPQSGKSFTGNGNDGAKAVIFRDGALYVSDAPGLGTDINEKLAAKYSYERAYLPMSRRADGSVHDW